MNLDLGYKGARSYVHGTDLYTHSQNALCKYQPGWITRIAFKQFATSQCQILVDEPDERAGLVAKGRYQVEDGDSLEFWLMETGAAIKERYKFDEEYLLGGARISEQTGVIDRYEGFSCIEHVVAMTKYLNNKLSPQPYGKKWFFGQLDLDKPLADSYQEVRINRNKLLNDVFSLNQISIDNVPVGQIRFIVGEAR